MPWSELIDESLERDMVEWRRHIHANPELSFKEHVTTGFIAELLADWDVVSERPLETGVVARLKGAGPGARVALRADIDALPIIEQNTFDFVSGNPGVMHACGHDGHTAILLGVTRVLARLQGRFKGVIVLLFQPAEERLNGGAQGFLAAGALEGVDAALGLHLWSGMETGRVSARSGPVFASTDEFKITLRGRGGHGAYPHQATDSVVAGAHIVTQLQTLVSRRVDPLAPAVVTVGSFHAGTAFNIIPDRAELVGTVRTLSPTAREQVRQELDRMVVAGAAALGVSAEVDYTQGNPVLVNDHEISALVRAAAQGVVKESSLVQEPPAMGGDDFAFIAERIPSCYFMVGAGNEDVGSKFPHHHPQFTIDEAALSVGARVLLDSVERALRTLEPAGVAPSTG
ncbi:MAG TPA: amidohydrolase [Acidimicrobiales bacterium]|nr:amidohydrolase [Acidimicrobiales bacterium]